MTLANALNGGLIQDSYKPPKSQRINSNEGMDVRETFSWTYDPRYDTNVPDVTSIPENARKFMRSEDFIWEATANLPQLKASITTYFAECLRLARALTRSFALSLDLDEEFFAQKVAYPDAAYAFNYYPPLASTNVGKTSVSIGSHTDFQLFTILWQDAVGGLQVLSRSGQWLNATPKQDTLVVNIGDYLQRITNGGYVSTVHRARNDSGRERVSMAFFWGFGLHESCGVLGEGEGEGEEIGCEEWVRRRVEDMLRVDDEEGGVVD